MPITWGDRPLPVHVRRPPEPAGRRPTAAAWGAWPTATLDRGRASALRGQGAHHAALLGHAEQCLHAVAQPLRRAASAGAAAVRAAMRLLSVSAGMRLLLLRVLLLVVRRLVLALALVLVLVLVLLRRLVLPRRLVVHAVEPEPGRHREPGRRHRRGLGRRRLRRRLPRSRPPERGPGPAMLRRLRLVVVVARRWLAWGGDPQ